MDRDGQIAADINKDARLCDLFCEAVRNYDAFIKNAVSDDNDPGLELAGDVPGFSDGAVIRAIMVKMEDAGATLEEAVESVHQEFAPK